MTYKRLSLSSRIFESGVNVSNTMGKNNSSHISYGRLAHWICPGVVSGTTSSSSLSSSPMTISGLAQSPASHPPLIGLTRYSITSPKDPRETVTLAYRDGGVSDLPDRYARASSFGTSCVVVVCVRKVQVCVLSYEQKI